MSGRTANLKLTSSLITRNIVENRPPGAGLRAVGGTVTLIGNTISDNEAGEEGGGSFLTVYYFPYEETKSLEIAPTSEAVAGLAYIEVAGI